MPRSPARLASGLGVMALGAALAWGATGIPSDAGYSGVGPNFLPWVVSMVLMGCGALLLWQAWRAPAPAVPDEAADASEPDGAPDWSAMGWMVAGVVANASLITRIGFVLSCALCFALAVRGLRMSEGRAGRGLLAWREGVRDLLIGACIALPVFWVFTQLLNISLPGLTASGWI